MLGLDTNISKDGLNMFLEFLKKCSKYPQKLCKYPEKMSKYLAIIALIYDERTVVNPLRKKGSVKKSQSHTNSLLSWQGCAQFGFARISRKVARLSQQANTAPCLLICD